MQVFILGLGGGGVYLNIYFQFWTGHLSIYPFKKISMLFGVQTSSLCGCRQGRRADPTASPCPGPKRKQMLKIPKGVRSHRTLEWPSKDPRAKENRIPAKPKNEVNPDPFKAKFFKKYFFWRFGVLSWGLGN